MDGLEAALPLLTVIVGGLVLFFIAVLAVCWGAAWSLLEQARRTAALAAPQPESQE